MLEEATSDALGDVNVGGVGTVASYSHDDQTATVEPVVKSRFVDPDTGEPEFIQPPPIPNVPIMFPSGGGYSITWPLQQGDTLYLCFADKSHDEWQNDGDDATKPQDPRRHDLTDAFGFPAGKSPADAIGASGTSTNAMVVDLANELHLGGANPGTWVARADDVASCFSSNEQIFNNHTHNYIVPLMPISPSPTIPPVSGQQTTTTESDVKSSIVRTD